MQKYAVVIDSTVYLPKEYIIEKGIQVVSLNVTDDLNKTHKEKDVTREFIQSEIDKGRSYKTSAPAPGEFLETYQQLFNTGYEKIFYIGLSKELSGTYNSAALARNMLDNPEDVYLFDTNSSAYGNEMLLYELIRYIEEGKEFEFIKLKIDDLIRNHTLLFTMENLFSLVKGGRLSTARAMVGTVLRVKPVVEMIDGKLILVKSERTYQKIFNLFKEKIDESLKGFDHLRVYITHTNSEKSGESLKAFILKHYPDARVTLTDLLGPVMTIHCGKRGFGLSWFVE